MELNSSFCRSVHRHGGVAVWSRVGLNVSRLDLGSFSKELHIEVCGLVWQDGQRQTYIFVFYRSPVGDFQLFLDTLADLIEQYYSPSNNYILLGDFNCHFELDDDSDAYRLRNLLLSFNLKEIVKEHTRANAILDNIFLSHSTRSLLCNVRQCFFSDHSYVFAGTAKSEIDTVTHRMTRIFSELNTLEFESFLRTEQWQDLYNFDNFNDAFNCFYNTFMYYFQLSFPLKVLLGSRPQSKRHWIGDELRRSSDEVRGWFELQNKFPCLREKYLYEKRRHISAINISKKLYFENKIISASNKTKAAWSVISELNGANKSRANIALEDGDSYIIDPISVANKFNNFFIEAPRSVVSRLPVPSGDAMGLVPVIQHSMCALPFCDLELLELLVKKLNNKMSAGPDELPCKILRRVVPLIIEPLCYLVNMSFSNGMFPECLKISLVHPLHKKDSRASITNYRPVSISSVFSKVFEYAMLTRLLGHLEKNNIIAKRQHGFRSNHSTSSAVYEFLKDVNTYIDKKQRPVAVFGDLSRAFDCVCHSMLLNKLHNYGIRGVIADWFCSYLSGRTQFVKLNYTFQDGRQQAFTSHFLPIDMGVPQGSILGPIIFLLFVNDLLYYIDSMSMYADDSSCVVSDDTVEGMEQSVKEILEQMCEWFDNNKLYLNLSKTSFMVFHNTQFRGDIDLNVKIKDETLKRQSSICFLGVHIEDVLNWKTHCSCLIGKLSSICFQIRSLRTVVDEDVLLSFYYASAFSRMSYGIIFWGCSGGASDVFIIQKRIIRCIVGIDSRTSCRPYFKRLKLLTLFAIYILELLLHIFKNKSSFKRHIDVHGYPTRQMNDFYPPLNTCNITKQSPDTWGVKFFNALPLELKQLENISVFKRKIKELLLDHCIYSIDEYFEMCNSL